MEFLKKGLYYLASIVLIVLTGTSIMIAIGMFLDKGEDTTTIGAVMVVVGLLFLAIYIFISKKLKPQCVLDDEIARKKHREISRQEVPERSKAMKNLETEEKMTTQEQESFREQEEINQKIERQNQRAIVRSEALERSRLAKKQKLEEAKLKEEIRLVKEQRKQAENIAKCPKCGSTSLSAQKKGFGIGKAVAGATLVGGFGLMAGNINAKKVWVTCLKCGKRFKM